MRANTASDFWQRVKKSNACWEWDGHLKKARYSNNKGGGYGLFRFNGKLRRAHRVAFSLANNLPVEFEGLILHTCDNPKCVRPDHLELGNHSKNIVDAYARGLRKYGNGPHGERNRHAKLTNADVLKIADLIREGRSNVEIASRFGVTAAMICRIRRGKSWKRLLSNVR